MNEAERTITVRNSCWRLHRVIVEIARTMSRSSLRGHITATSSRAGKVDLRTARNISYRGLMKLEARLGDEIHIRVAGSDAEKILNLFEKAAVEASEKARQEYIKAMKVARGQGDLERMRKYAAFIETRSQ